MPASFLLKCTLIFTLIIFSFGQLDMMMMVPGGTKPCGIDVPTMKSSMFQNEISGKFNVMVPTKVNKNARGEIISEEYTIDMVKTKQQFLPPLMFGKTTIYAYGGNTSRGYYEGFPGPVILATKDRPVKITWRNKISDPHILPVDFNYPFINDTAFRNEVPTVPHIHGLVTNMSSDGEPEAYWTKNGLKGKDYKSQQKTSSDSAVFIYPNQQDAGNFWYHDHTLGLTRLNVYAGLVGLYKILDPNNKKQLEIVNRYGILELDSKFLVITDKTFKKNGELMYNQDSTNPLFTTWQPEFFGDVMLVNGFAWPKMVLQQTKHRFVLLNACQGRYLNIWFDNNGKKVPFELIRVDGNFYQNPVVVDTLLATISTRFEFILDLTNVVGEIIMKNDAPAPYPTGDPANFDAVHIGQIMKICVHRGSQATGSINWNQGVQINQGNQNSNVIFNPMNLLPNNFNPNNFNPNNLNTNNGNTNNFNQNTFNPNNFNPNNFNPSNMNGNNISQNNGNPSNFNPNIIVNPTNLNPGNFNPNNMNSGNLNPGNFNPGNFNPNNLNSGNFNPTNFNPNNLNPNIFNPTNTNSPTNQNPTLPNNNNFPNFNFPNTNTNSQIVQNPTLPNTNNFLNFNFPNTNSNTNVNNFNPAGNLNPGNTNQINSNPLNFNPANPTIISPPANFNIPNTNTNNMNFMQMPVFPIRNLQKSTSFNEFKDLQLINSNKNTAQPQNYPKYSAEQKVFTTLFQIQNDQGQVNAGFIDGMSMMNTMKCPNSTYQIGKTYDFYFINLTPDMHPFHFHLVNMQKVKQFKIDPIKYAEKYFKINGGKPDRMGWKKPPKSLDPEEFRVGPDEFPEEHERIFRDTIDTRSEYVTVMRIKFAKNDGSLTKSFDMKGQRFVLHCHILDHEDNEMMKYFCLK